MLGVVREKLVDVQLINCADKGDLHHIADFPYGLALIAAYLREQGYSTLLHQYPAYDKPNYINKILDNPAYLYGFQVSFTNYPDITEVIQLVKKNNPSVENSDSFHQIIKDINDYSNGAAYFFDNVPAKAQPTPVNITDSNEILFKTPFASSNPPICARPPIKNRGFVRFNEE